MSDKFNKIFDNENSQPIIENFAEIITLASVLCGCEVKQYDNSPHFLVLTPSRNKMTNYLLRVPSKVATVSEIYYGYLTVAEIYNSSVDKNAQIKIPDISLINVNSEDLVNLNNSLIETVKSKENNHFIDLRVGALNTDENTCKNQMIYKMAKSASNRVNSGYVIPPYCNDLKRSPRR